MVACDPGHSIAGKVGDYPSGEVTGNQGGLRTSGNFIQGVNAGTKGK